MPTTRVVMSIHDDQTGEGPDLVFPTMSTCCACICVLANRLVGVHKTQGWRARLITLFRHAVGLINNAHMNGLYLVGWNVGNPTYHDVPQIRAALNCMAVPTSIYNLANATKANGAMAFEAPRSMGDQTSDVCTFAFGNAGHAPHIGI